MGLDWNPGPKPRSGHEEEFVRLWRELHAPEPADRDRKAERFAEITVSAFETLKTPRVGFDPAADRWAQQAFHRRSDKSISERDFVARMRGFYVLELVPDCDGLPRYTNGSPGGYVERYSFRAQFLVEYEDILGAELIEQAFVSKLPKVAGEYGRALHDCALRYAGAHGIDLAGVHIAEDPDCIEFHLDAVLVAARWCRYWARNGHWLEAYY